MRYIDKIPGIGGFNCLLVLVTLFFSMPLPAEKVLSAEELFKKVSPSVFAVEIYDGSEAISTGSAVATAPFVIPGKDNQFGSFDRIAYPELFIRASQSTDVVVTNFHLLRDRVWQNESRYFISWGARRILAEVVEIDVNHDLMWLKAAGLNAPRVRLRDSSTLSVGERVYSVGSP
jgi:S1-C subfamily serine protease